METLAVQNLVRFTQTKNSLWLVQEMLKVILNISLIAVQNLPDCKILVGSSDMTSFENWFIEIKIIFTA